MSAPPAVECPHLTGTAACTVCVERERLWAQRQAVLGMHQPIREGQTDWCAEDGATWPCRTARALGVPNG